MMYMYTLFIMIATLYMVVSSVAEECRILSTAV